jgi:hypothetical protein
MSGPDNLGDDVGPKALTEGQGNFLAGVMAGLTALGLSNCKTASRVRDRLEEDAKINPELSEKNRKLIVEFRNGAF